MVRKLLNDRELNYLCSLVKILFLNHLLKLNPTPPHGRAIAPLNRPLPQAVQTSLTLAIPAIPTKITPTRMLQLPAAFGADANHR